MELFSASFETVLYRFYLLMAVVVVSFLIGLPVLAFLALPIFLSAFMGINFKPLLKKLGNARIIGISREGSSLEKAA